MTLSPLALRYSRYSINSRLRRDAFLDTAPSYGLLGVAEVRPEARLMVAPFLTPAVAELLEQVAAGPVPDPSAAAQRAALDGAMAAWGWA